MGLDRTIHDEKSAVQPVYQFRSKDIVRAKITHIEGEKVDLGSLNVDNDKFSAERSASKRFDDEVPSEVWSVLSDLPNFPVEIGDVVCDTGCFLAGGYRCWNTEVLECWGGFASTFRLSISLP